VKIGNSEEVCDEYLNQNISDEEGRMSGERVTSEKGGKKQKAIEIANVDFLDKSGNKKNVFETGDDLSIRVYFKQNIKVEKINFGLAIFNQEGHYAFGVSTFTDKVDTKTFIQRGYCQVDYKNIPFRTDAYYIGFAIYGENDKVAYDYEPRLRAFKVFSHDRNSGMVNVEYKWS
jgi:hypothetical protein